MADTVGRSNRAGADREAGHELCAWVVGAISADGCEGRGDLEPGLWGDGALGRRLGAVKLGHDVGNVAPNGEGESGLCGDVTRRLVRQRQR